MIPKKDVDPAKWAVVACDQFTSQPEYWEKLAAFVGESPSALKVIFPEAYLADKPAERIAGINGCMTCYLKENLFRGLGDSMVLVERDTQETKGRLGLILSVDLEAFDYRPFTSAPIRATEGTVLDRIPPRLAIRKNAPLELPHIMLLTDEPQGGVIEELFARRGKLEKLYDFDLNMGGGHLRSYKVDNADEVKEKFLALLSSDVQKAKYGRDAGFLFAVGDGNHSLVTAKTHWENLKGTLPESEREKHPARFALVEVENIHSAGLVFEPIHRVLFGNVKDVVDELQAACGGDGFVTLVTADGDKKLAVSANGIEAIAQIQGFIDRKLADKNGFQVDYIHGENYTRQVTENLGGIGILMPTVAKSELFPFVLEHGVMPKKSFSMGEAEEKRYYFEAKKII